MSYIYPISATANNNVKKNLLIYQINTSGITSATLIDVLIYNDSINILFTADLTLTDPTTLTSIVNAHNPSTQDTYPFYTDEYYVKVSQSDQGANFLSSSIISSNNIRYTIINQGGNELYQTFVNTSDGVIGTDVIWSSYYINSLISTDINSNIATVFYYLSSSISICY